MKAGEPAERQTIWLVSPVYYDVESYLMLRQRARDCLTQVPTSDVRFVAVDDTAGADVAVRSLETLPDQVVVTPPILSVTSAHWCSDCVACRPCCAIAMSW